MFSGPARGSMKKCSRCGVGIDGRRGNARYCGSCAVLSLAASWSCSKKVCSAIKRGAIPSPQAMKCEDCGSPAEVYDHRDYSKPLAVAAVCGGCNARRGPAVWRTDAELTQREAA